MDKTLLHSPFQNMMITAQKPVHARLTLLLNTVGCTQKIVTGKVQVAYFENVFSYWIEEFFQMISKLSLLHNCINEDPYEIVTSRSRGYMYYAIIDFNIGCFRDLST